MATFRNSLLMINDTAAHFIAWGSFISGAFSGSGWIQQNDTGQIQFTTITCSITNAVSSGGFATYTFSGATLSLRNGMSIAVTGCTTAAFNITGNIVNLSGTTSGTFQLALAGTNSSEVETATGTVAAYSGNPATSSQTIGYEIWAAADALQSTMPFFARIDYRTSGTNIPVVSITIGRGSNGSGTINNGATAVAGTVGDYSSGSGTSGPYDCIASGDSGRLQIFMWRNISGAASGWDSHFFLNLERSVNSSGTLTNEFIYYQLGYLNSTHTGVFSSNWVNNLGIVGTPRTLAEMPTNADPSCTSNGVTGVFPTRPVIGGERTPLFGLIRGAVNDWNDGDIVPISLYPGVTHNYFVNKLNSGAVGNVNWACGGAISANNVCLMRYE